MRDRTLSTYLQKDLDVIAGRPDGGLVFIDFIGFDVPSFVDPRYDLIVPGQVKTTPRLNHHVPLAFRGPFRPNDLPEKDLWVGETNEEGYCVCSGKRKDGLPCRALAANRSPYCSNHGGQLHAADRQMKNLPDGILPDISQITKLSRAQKVQMGLIPIEELGNDEITGQFVWDDDGRKVTGRKLNERIHGLMVKEMMTRMQDKIIQGLPEVLDSMLTMATDPLVEPGDRIKAGIWWAERVIGKTPDVIVHAKSDKPIDQIFGQLETTTRDQYRNAISSERIVDAEVIDEDEQPVSGNDGMAAQRRSAGSAGNDSASRADVGNMDRVRSTANEAGFDGDDSDTWPDLVDPADNYPISKAIDFLDVDSDSGSDNLHGVNNDRPNVGSSAAGLAERRKRLAEQRAALAKAKSRRFAARAQGLVGTEDLAYALEFKRTGTPGLWYMKLHAPEDLTQEILDRIAMQEQLRANAPVSA